MEETCNVNCDNICDMDHNGNLKANLSADCRSQYLENCDFKNKVVGTGDENVRIDQFKNNQNYASSTIKGFCSGKKYKVWKPKESLGGGSKRRKQKRRNTKKKRRNYRKK
jgi:hypothetical protein